VSRGSVPAVPDERPLHERLLELAVYVPVGIMASIAEELPGLADKGRRRVESRIQVARMVGKLAVAEAQRRITPRTPSPARNEAESEPAAPAGTARQPASAPVGNGESDSSSRERGAAGSAERPPHVAELAIPGYDTLAASQVVQRLASLRADELEAVRRYEAANRGRRTILHRIAQLSRADGRASA
jgi:hypothetical protein